MKKLLLLNAADALADCPQEDIALLMLTAPDAGSPPRRILEGALDKLALHPQKKARRWNVSSMAGWGVAASLAVAWVSREVLPAGHWWHFSSDSANTKEKRKSPSDGGSSENGRNGAELVLDGGNSQKQPLKPKVGSLLTSQKILPVGDANVLRPRSLVNTESSGKDASQALTQGTLSRTVVVEMFDPSNPGQKQRRQTAALTDRVADSIAAGVPQPDPASTEKTPLVLSGGDGSWNGEVLIEKGLPNTGMLSLTPGTQIRHKDFPVDSASQYRGLKGLGDGWFFDQFSNLLWGPTGQGREYIGEAPPEGFDAETFVPPGKIALPRPKPQPEPVPDADADADAATENAAVRAYPIFDETTGTGSIILQNLPPAPEGHTYQLWATDESGGNAGSIGLLPPPQAGGDRVWFDLGQPGPAPRGYLLTVEPSTGSKVPSGRIVLQGP